MERRTFIGSGAAMALVPSVVTAAPATTATALLENMMSSVVPLTPNHLGVRKEHLEILCDELGVEFSEAWWNRGGNE